jgi:hypothetical protein
VATAVEESDYNKNVSWHGEVDYAASILDRRCC